jgi:predicted GIY-YIG superfamily endonuclease
MIGKIYILFFPDGYWYVGSTTQRYMSQRLAQHKIKTHLGRTSNLYNHIRDVGWDTMDCEILEEVDVKTIEELRQCEQRYIDENKDTYCLNELKAFTGLTKKDYWKDYQKKHPDLYKTIRAKYRETHRKQRSEYNKAYRLKKKQALVECQPQESNSVLLEE